MSLLNSLVGYWKFDGDATDEVASADGTGSGGISFAGTGKLNNCASLDGTDDFVQIFDSEAADAAYRTIGNANAYSISMWIKGTASGSVAGSWYPGTVLLELRQEKTTNCKVPFSFGITSTVLEIGRTHNYVTSDERVSASSVDVVDDAWHHVVVTVNGNAVNFYVDGNSDGSATFTTATGDCSVAADDVNFGIGTRWKDNGAPDNNYNFTGLIDEVGIWAKALTSGDVTTLYNSGNAFSYDSFTSTEIVTAVVAEISYSGIAPAITGGTQNILAVASVVGYGGGAIPCRAIIPDASVVNYAGGIPTIRNLYWIVPPASIVGYDGNAIPGRAIIPDAAVIDYAGGIAAITGGTQVASAIAAIINYAGNPIPSRAISPSAAVINYDAIEPSITTFTINFDNAFVVYKFYLSGLEIPIESFQSRLRDGTPTYLSVVIKGLSYASAIAARSTGDMVVKMGLKQDGVIRQIEEIIKVDLEDIVINEGAKSKSIKIVGHRTQSYNTKSVTIADISYRKIKGSEYTIRTVRPDIYLRPGDTVTDPDSNSFVVGLITHTFQAGQGTMEISSRAQ